MDRRAPPEAQLISSSSPEAGQRSTSFVSVYASKPWSAPLDYRLARRRDGGNGSGSEFLLRSRCSPGPGQEFVDAIIRPAVYELGEDVCEISLGIDVI